MHIPRKYQGPDDPSLFMGYIKRMSFQLENMNRYINNDFTSLKAVTPFGRVVVTRVRNDLEIVQAWIIAEGLYIVLIPNSDDKYYLKVTLSPNDYTFSDEFETSGIGNFEIYDDYYTSPYYDSLRENCPAIINNNKTNYVTVPPSNVLLSPSGKWDDWHYHYMYYVGMPRGLTCSDEIFRPPGRRGQSVGGVIHFSMVDYTAGYGHFITSRYIDQLKRNYFPYSTIVTDIEGSKSEFVLTDGILRYYGKNAGDECIEYLSQIPPPDGVDAIQFFWPWIPYLNEIGHFGILSFGRTDPSYGISTLSPGLSSMYNWNLFSDTMSFINGEYTRDYSYPINITDYYSYTGSGIETIIETESAYSSTGTKYSPIAPIGNKKACYVKTDWKTSGSGPVMNQVMVTVTEGNYPINFLVQGGFMGQGTIPPGDYRNDSTTEGTWSESASNRVNITQQLMFGDDVIATGESVMSYSMSRNGVYNYIGFLHTILEGPPSCTCGGESINYTSLQMQTNSSQGLSVKDSQIGCIYTWELSSGGGSLSSFEGLTTTYASPSSNPNCTSNPTISLKCGGNIVASITLAVYNPAMNDVVGYLPNSCSKRRVLGYCSGQYYGNDFRCDGQLATGRYCQGFGQACSIDEMEAKLATLCELSLATCAAIDQRNAEQLEGGCCPQQLL